MLGEISNKGVTSMLIDAVKIYCKKKGMKLLNTDNNISSDIFEHINDYIYDDYFEYKVDIFVCNKNSELPDIFIVEDSSHEFLVYERIIDDFCCLSHQKK
ncbi:hypothetical protein HKU74_004804, partial [Salmonella enterica subsp. enterica serovar Kentucky]|nr:hypothetical protein [Salmonella enterica subsp. enterica serovar Kentucky]EGF7734259.1 hypothetical protein [Salmonella enterica subsp. enterica serovar Kentucky]